PAEHDALARSLPTWEPFPEVPTALAEARSRGWKLAILSNTDRDFIDASMRNLGVLFELAIVASEVGSYKPGHRHWEAFFEQTGAPRDGRIHVAASLFHDIAPANDRGPPPTRPPSSSPPRHEHLPGQVPRLQHVHGRPSRPELRMPRVRPRVRRGARPAPRGGGRGGRRD